MKTKRNSSSCGKLGLIGAAVVSVFLARVSVFADEADDALALARRTLDYVAKSVPEKTLKPYARELKVDATWLAGETNAAFRAGIVRDLHHAFEPECHELQLRGARINKSVFGVGGGCYLPDV